MAKRPAVRWMMLAICIVERVWLKFGKLRM